MALFTKTSSANTPLTISSSDLGTPSRIASYINAYYTTLVDELNGVIDSDPLIGLLKSGTQKKDTEVIKMKVKGNSTVPLNEDGNALPFLQFGEGWDHSVNVYPYRLAVKHTRHLEEIESAEDVSSVMQEVRELMDAGDRTIKFMVADLWNRAVDPTSGSQVLCPDGMYICDDDRPNPVDGVPDWSNLEALGDIDEDTLFAADLNCAFQIAHNGDDLPTSIKKIHIPKGFGHVTWQLDKSQKDPTSGMNTANWAAGRFAYEEHTALTANAILYQLADIGSDANGIELRWAVRPGTQPIRFEDPDIIGQRLRFRCGIGIVRDPRAMWRGGKLNAL